MRAVVQRVSEASVSVEERVVGSISRGLCVLVGVENDDSQRDVGTLANKLRNLRVFQDSDGKMNLSVVQTGGQLLLISQFTLLGDVRRGNRPSFAAAMAPEQANQLFELLCAELRGAGLAVETGRFRASMRVSLVNDGPVTILLDTRKVF